MDKTKFNISLREEEKELTETIKTLNEKLSAIQVVLKVYEKDFFSTKENFDLFNSNQNTTENNIVHEKADNDKTTISSRTLEALEFIGSGTANQVGDTVNELYPYIPIEKAKLDSRITLSRLKTAGKIEGEKVQGQLYYLYTFIKQDEAAELQPQKNT